MTRAGKKPDFKEEILEFDIIKTDTSKVTFTFFDKEAFKDEDDVICDGFYDISEMINQGKFDTTETIQLSYDGKSAGIFETFIRFEETK